MHGALSHDFLIAIAICKILVGSLTAVLMKINKINHVVAECLRIRSSTERGSELQRNLRVSKGVALAHVVQEGLRNPSWRLRRGAAK